MNLEKQTYSEYKAMNPDPTATEHAHRISKNTGGAVSALIDYCQFQLGVLIEARIENGNLRIRADDYADWLLARVAAREKFGFNPDNIIREL